MKLNKWLTAVCAVALVFTLAACGGEKTNADPVQETPAASAASDNQAAPETSAASDGQAADEQAMADADYEQLKQLMSATVAHEDLITQMGALREQVVNGEATEDALVEAYKQLSDDSQLILSSVQAAEWQTEQYAEHVALLTAAVEALAESELVAYEASAENDESKLESVAELTYNI
jgi:hypothetical protein